MDLKLFLDPLRIKNYLRVNKQAIKTDRMFEEGTKLI